MQTPKSIKLTRPWGVVVKTGGKVVLKEFDTESEAQSFGQQLSAFDNVEFEIIEKPTRGIAGRENSLAFVRVDNRNMPGGFFYRCVQVKQEPGRLFCTECHDYRKFVDVTDRYELTLRCCSECGISVNDFYIKTANGLWERPTSS